jgi:FkbM family methyltransferase
MNSIRYILNRFWLLPKVAKIKIAETGTDKDGHLFIKLTNEKIFFGNKSKSKLRKYYRFLPRKIKTLLPFDWFEIANNIIIRYQEGGLKLRGPRKELFYSVKPNDVIAEMGAYMGYYTIYLAEKAHRGKIIAIEPMPQNLVFLKKNIKYNNLKNVTIVSKGVWNKNEIMPFTFKDGDNQSGSIPLTYSEEKNVNIEVDTLDTILAGTETSHVDFMIIQLNGAEKEALEALTNYLPKNFAIAARYNNKNESTAQKVINILKDRNYEVKIKKKYFIYAKHKHLNQK